MTVSTVSAGGTWSIAAAVVAVAAWTVWKLYRRSTNDDADVEPDEIDKVY